VNLLVAVPIKAGISGLLFDRLVDTTQALKAANPTATLALYLDKPRPALDVDDPDYVMKRSCDLASARNDLLATWLKPEHTHVLWIDADIVEYPPDLPQRLLAAAGEDCIVAPMVLLKYCVEVSYTITAAGEDSIAEPILQLDHIEQYYDTYTHIMDTGEQVAIAPPYFGDVGDADLVSMACVGGCYLIPADIYRSHCYDAFEGPGMEHWTLMQTARAIGYKIFVDLHTTVRHAFLPVWEESFH